MTAPGAPARLLESTLRIRPGEGRRTALLFLHLLLASAVFFLGRTVRDTLFLSRYPLTALPWMFVVYGAVSALVALLYGRLADRLPRQRMIVASCVVGAATYALAWFGVHADVRFVYPAFYVWTEVVANLFIVQFWTLAGDLYDARTARRLFGFIGSARLLASVVVGLLAGAVVRALGTPQLILILASLMAGIAAVAIVIGRQVRSERTQRPGWTPPRTGAKQRVLADPYVSALALLLLLAFTALNIGDYQFKAIARAHYSGDELAGFFARFYAISGSVAFLFQLLVTPRILARAGVGAGMAVMPTAFGLSSAALLAWPRVIVAALLKFSDNGFQYTIQESTFQALYVPFPAATRARTRALLDAVVKPLGFALAGVAVIVFGATFAGAPHRFSLISLPLIAGWLALIPVVRRRYLRRLEATLTTRGTLGFDEAFVLDAAGRRMLVGTLWEGQPRQILIALEQLAGERTADVSQATLALAGHADALVREAALTHIANAPPPGGASADIACVRSALADPVPAVRAAAALAIGATLKSDAVADLVPLLADPDERTRGNALAGLLRDGGVEGGITGGGELARLLDSRNRDDLVVAARAARYLGTGAYLPLRALLTSADPSVRRAALQSAAGLAEPRLVPVLIDLLSDPACRARAGPALVATGEAAVAPLGALLGDEHVPRAVRLEVPRLMRRILKPESYELLKAHVRAPDSRLRLRLHAALAHLRRDLSLPPEPVRVIRELVEAEIAEAERNRIGWSAARGRFSSPLLDELFRTRRERVMRRVLRILGLRYDMAALALVRERIHDPARRANALEVLDALLDPALRAIVLPFAEDAATRRQDPPAPDPVQFLAAHCRHPNPYVVLLALDALARRGEPAGAEEGARLLSHPDPLVREGAARAVASTAVNAREKRMYSTLEKLLFLKSAAIFERVSGEDLAPLARIAELQSYAPGEIIVREGDTGDALFVLVHGQAVVESGGHAIATLAPGDSIGEMAVLDSEPRSATVRASGEAEALRIGSEEFYEILHEQVEIAEGVIRVLSQRLRRVDRQVAT